MKTKEVIKMLNELDPSGEYQVCIENADIERFDVLPAYYDGRISVITEKEEKNRWFIPKKTEVTGSGTKLNLYRHDWQYTFRESIEERGVEYPIESGEGASGPAGFNWLNAETICSQYKLTIQAEQDIIIYEKNEERKEKRVQLCKDLRTKYIKYISERLNHYINASKHFYSEVMKQTSYKLVEKCSDVEFPLEVFRFGQDYASNRNAHWRGFEFKVDSEGKFFVKDYVNNKKIDEQTRIDNTPFVEQDIETYDFKNIVNIYFEVIKKLDDY